MQNRTIKTVGAAALGVAFAAAAAGTASAAAPATPLPELPAVASTVLDAPPLQAAAKPLPGAQESTMAAKKALTGATGATAPMPGGKSPLATAGGLLGGLAPGSLPLG